MKFFGKVKFFLNALVECCFPKICILCGDKIHEGLCYNICERCLKGIDWLKGPRCSCCGRPMGAGFREDEAAIVCQSCQEKPPFFKDRLLCWNHAGNGRKLIHALKYYNAWYLHRDIAVLLKTYCPAAIDYIRHAVLVPVPIAWSRRVHRGYNQSDVIVRALQRLSSEVRVARMLRAFKKPSQTHLGFSQRQTNVRGKFQVTWKQSFIARDSRIIVVDDVSTTGATVDECCKVLRRAGFYDLHVLTLSFG